MKISKFLIDYPFLGDESYDNQIKYGSEVFKELKQLQQNGVYFEGIRHKIIIVCCSDWKAAACIEGK